jgi:hypothetical protein
MTKLEFEKLSNTEQGDMLNKYGVFLAQRVIGINRVYLYSISSFYIELFHQLTDERNSGIRIMKVFENPDMLDLYLEYIDVSDLQLNHRGPN